MNDSEKNVLIIGAGEAGRMVVDELFAHPEAGLAAAGFIDDDPSLARESYRGVPVLGDRGEIPGAVDRLDIHEVVIAIPSARGRVIRELVSSCEGLGLQVKIVPPIMEIILGDVRFEQIRTVQPEDLLGRESILIDEEGAAAYLRGKSVLVTGGGGSIGRGIAAACALGGAREIILAGRGENSLHDALLVLESGPAAARKAHIRPLIADIGNRKLVSRLVSEISPDVIFHAAAHKHIRFMELFPVEAVRNNILATAALLDAAEETGVSRFVMLSTDKAVAPTSVMGASKRFCELLVLEKARKTGARYMSVRFGNVLGSRGSVVPKFRRQIAAGGPVTVSDPDATRFFMTTREASYLVVKAGGFGTGGELFVLDMGEPVNIHRLARNLIYLSGLEPDRDIEIEFTGLGPGEKLHEEILTASEGLTATVQEKIFVARPESAEPVELQAALSLFEACAASGDAPASISVLADIVPEYDPDL